MPTTTKGTADARRAAIAAAVTRRARLKNPEAPAATPAEVDAELSRKPRGMAVTLRKSFTNTFIPKDMMTTPAPGPQGPSNAEMVAQAQERRRLRREGKLEW